MLLTIHQAYFIPWLGYFSKLAFSDAFVVLDNVQFRKRHYFDRTRIVNMHGEIRWLSLPVGENFQAPYDSVRVNSPDDSYVHKLLATIEQSYARARAFDQEWTDLHTAIDRPLKKHRRLLDINLGIISNILGLVGVNMPDIHLSSRLVTKDKDRNATWRIIDICEALGADSIVIGGGMSQTVHDLNIVANAGINVYVQDYLDIHPVYEQSRRKRAGFQPGLSILDSILNVGRKQTANFISDGAYNPIPIKIDEVKK